MPQQLRSPIALPSSIGAAPSRLACVEHKELVLDGVPYIPCTERLQPGSRWLPGSAWRSATYGVSCSDIKFT